MIHNINSTSYITDIIYILNYVCIIYIDVITNTRTPHLVPVICPVHQEIRGFPNTHVKREQRDTKEETENIFRHAPTYNLLPRHTNRYMHAR